MPYLIHQSIDLTYDLLLSKGVNIQENIIETANIKMSGKIAGQTPGSGAYLVKNSTAHLRVYWHKMKDHPYIAYEKVDFTVPEDQIAGLYEAFVEDFGPKRIRYSAKKRPGQKIAFVFRRTGNAKITITCDKKPVRIIGFKVDQYD